MKPPRYLFRDIAPGGDFHAALISLRAGRDSDQALHRHDFWELMYLLEGKSRHWINGHSTTLASGEMLLIRPDDCHRVQAAPGETRNCTMRCKSGRHPPTHPQPRSRRGAARLAPPFFEIFSRRISSVRRDWI